MQIPKPGAKPPSEEDIALAPFSVQLPILFAKAARSNYRSPNYTWIRQAFYLFVGLFYGTVYFQLPFDTLQGIQSRIAFVYMTTTFSGVVAFNTVIPMLSEGRVVYYREKAARAYDVSPYSFALSITEIPYIISTSFFFVVIIWFTVPLNENAPRSIFGFYLLVIFIYTLLQVYLGQLFAIAFKDAKTATAAGSAVIMLWNLFAGFLVPYEQIPNGWRFMYWLSATHYAVESLEVDQFFCDVAAEAAEGNLCPMMEVEPGAIPGFNGTEIPVWTYIEGYYGFNPAMKWWNVVIMFVFTLAFNFGRYYGLKYISHLSR